MEPVELIDDRVRLRRHRESDVDRIVEQCRDPESVRWTTVPSPYGRQDGEEFVERRAQAWADGPAEGSELGFAICTPDDDRFLGSIGVGPRAGGAGDVGYGLHPDGRGRGVMTAALRLVAGWALDPAGLDLGVLHWEAILGNWPSRRVAWKAGFRVEGTVRGLVEARGTRSDAWIGSRRRDDPTRPTTPWLDVPVILDPDVTLRPFRDEDVPAVVETCTDRGTRRFLSQLPEPYTAESAAAFVERCTADAADASRVTWCVADPASDDCVGSVSLGSLDLAFRSAEVGYWVHPAARGRGLAVAAVRAAVAHAFTEVGGGGLGLRRLDLQAAASNTASRRVAERAGFAEAGRLRLAKLLGDGTYDDYVAYDRLAPGTA